MMNYTSPLPEVQYSSVKWHVSTASPGVKYAIRRTSLLNRMELIQNVREAMLKYEFLRSGGNEEQLEASLADLVVRNLYLSWGLVEISGLQIDGLSATPNLLLERGPEALTQEIATVIQAALGLSDEERKNS